MNRFLKGQKEKNLLYLYICNKSWLPSSVCKRCGSKDEKLFKEEDSIEIFKNFVLIENI